MRHEPEEIIWDKTTGALTPSSWMLPCDTEEKPRKRVTYSQVKENKAMNLGSSTGLAMRVQTCKMQLVTLGTVHRT